VDPERRRTRRILYYPVGSSASACRSKVAAGIPAGRVDSVVVLPFPAGQTRPTLGRVTTTLAAAPTHAPSNPSLSTAGGRGAGLVASEPV